MIGKKEPEMEKNNLSKYLKWSIAFLFGLTILYLLIWSESLATLLSKGAPTPSPWLFRLEIMVVILAIVSRWERIQEVIHIWNTWREGISILRYSLESVGIAFLIMLILSSNVLINFSSSVLMNNFLLVSFFAFVTVGLTLWILVALSGTLDGPKLVREPYLFGDNTVIEELKKLGLNILREENAKLDLLSLSKKPESEFVEVLLGKEKKLLTVEEKKRLANEEIKLLEDMGALVDEEKKRLINEKIKQLTEEEKKKSKWEIVLRLELDLAGNINNIVRYDNVEDYRKL